MLMLAKISNESQIKEQFSGSCLIHPYNHYEEVMEIQVVFLLTLLSYAVVNLLFVPQILKFKVN